MIYKTSDELDLCRIASKSVLLPWVKNPVLYKYRNWVDKKAAMVYFTLLTTFSHNISQTERHHCCS